MKRSRTRRRGTSRRAFRSRRASRRPFRSRRASRRRRSSRRPFRSRRSSRRSHANRMKGGAVDPVMKLLDNPVGYSKIYDQDRVRILERLSSRTTEYHAIYGQSCKALPGYNEKLATLLRGHIAGHPTTNHVVFLLGPSDEKNEMRGTLIDQTLETRTYIQFEKFPICLYYYNNYNNDSNNIIICELCAERTKGEFFKTKTGAVGVPGVKPRPPMMDHRGSVNTFENMIELMVCNAMFGKIPDVVEHGGCKASDIHHWAGCGSPQILRTAFNFFPVTGGSQVEDVRTILATVSTWSGFEGTANINDEQIAKILQGQGARFSDDIPKFLSGEDITDFMNQIFDQRPLCLASCNEMIQWMKSWKDGWANDKFSSFPIGTTEYDNKLTMEVNNITKYLAGFNKGDIKQSWATFQTLEDKTKFPQNIRDY